MGYYGSDRAELVGHGLFDRLLMHPRQPCACVEGPYALSIQLEWKDKDIVCKKDGAEDSSNNYRITVFKHPVEQIDSESKRDELLAHAHGYQHLGCIGRICKS